MRTLLRSVLCSVLVVAASSCSAPSKSESINCKGLKYGGSTPSSAQFILKGNTLKVINLEEDVPPIYKENTYVFGEKGDFGNRIEWRDKSKKSINLISNNKVINTIDLQKCRSCIVGYTPFENCQTK